MPGLLSSIVARLAAARQIKPNSASFVTSLIQNGLIATVPDPFQGLGLGVTTYTTFGTVPSQLTLVGNKILAGGGAASGGVQYSIGVLATSGDGTRLIGNTYTFGAEGVAAVQHFSIAGAVDQAEGNPVQHFSIAGATDQFEGSPAQDFSILASNL